MTSSPTTENASRGRVLRVQDGLVIFQPAGTNYEIHMQPIGGYDGPIDVPVIGVIRVRARKVYTVPSGGSFVAPIFGPPRTIQGRVRSVSETNITVHAACEFAVELPAGSDAIDLGSGSITVGGMVNVVALPGATFELLPPTASGG
jgi:hypothetical protein